MSVSGQSFSTILATIVVAVGAIVAAYVARTNAQAAAKGKLPPGPPKKWLIGNLFEMQTKHSWIQFTDWKKKYGDLVYLSGLGNSVLILNSFEAVNDLLDKRGTNYADRPDFHMAVDLMKLGGSMPVLPYGDEWRAQRKLTIGTLSPTAVRQYERVQEDLTAILCQSLIETPEKFIEHVRLVAGRIIMSISYGLPIRTGDNEYITFAETAMELFGLVSVPGTYLVEWIPWLQYLPSWLPGTDFLQAAQRGHDYGKRLFGGPFDDVRKLMRENNAQQSFTRDVLAKAMDEKGNIEEEVIDRIRWAAGGLYSAGGEATYTTVLTFMMMMAMYPEKQDIAQKELDSVVGTDRLPGFPDREQLPYVEAVIKETMRWNPMLPNGIARKTTKDDNYKGYFIPAGTIVIPNSWGTAFSPDASGHDPQHFVPERHINNPTIVDPRNYVFGYGRRVCPGKLMGENNLFILVATILSVFRVSLPVDENGKEYPINPDRRKNFGGDLVSYPKDYKLTIKLRDASKRSLVDSRLATVNVI